LIASFSKSNILENYLNEFFLISSLTNIYELIKIEYVIEKCIFLHNNNDNIIFIKIKLFGFGMYFIEGSNFYGGQKYFSGGQKYSSWGSKILYRGVYLHYNIFCLIKQNIL
jgi:hypothetical protein